MIKVEYENRKNFISMLKELIVDIPTFEALDA